MRIKSINIRNYRNLGVAKLESIPKKFNSKMQEEIESINEEFNSDINEKEYSKRSKFENILTKI